MEFNKIVWLSSTKETKFSDHYYLMIESGIYKEEPIPPNVNLKDKDSEVTQYYLKRLQEEYVGIIIIVDEAKIYISNENRH